MRTYIILPSKSGGWKIKEKRYFVTVATVNGTYTDACKKLAEIKEADKKEAEEKKIKKAEIKKAAAEYEIEFEKIGSLYKIGKTKSGKGFTLEGNRGFTNRSRYCYTLTIEGIGCIFTSGTIEAAVEYILNN